MGKCSPNGIMTSVRANVVGKPKTCVLCVCVCRFANWIKFGSPQIAYLANWIITHSTILWYLYVEIGITSHSELLILLFMVT